MPLAAPLSGTLVRRWQGLKWTVALPAGATRVPLQVGTGQLAISGSLSDLSGSGSIQPKDGMPSQAAGTLAFTLTLTALTQPVVEQQRIDWTLKDLAP